jgi:phage-related protein
MNQAIGFVKEAISILGPTLSGVWETFKGTFNLLDGLFTGDWKKMWDGLIDVAVGASKVIVNLVLGMMHPIAAVIDSIGLATGQNYGLSNMVSQMQAGVNSGALERGTQVLKDMVPPSAPSAT